MEIEEPIDEAYETMKSSQLYAQRQFLNFSLFDSVSSSRVLTDVTPSVQILSLNISGQGWGVTQMRELCTLQMGQNLCELQMNFSSNSFGDEGHCVFTEWVCQRAQSLEVLKVNFNATCLRTRSVSMLTVLNYLQRLRVLTLSFQRNNIRLEDEVKSIINQFKNPKAFIQLESLSIRLDECADSENIQRESNAQSHQTSLIASREAISAINELTKQLSSLKSQYSKLQTQMTPEIQASFTQAINKNSSQIQYYQQIAAQASKSLQKKTLLGKLLELMLRFTESLKEFELEIPGKLLDSPSFDQFAQLLKLKQQKLEKFSLTTRSVVEIQNNSSDHFFYQLGKISKLKELVINLEGLVLTDPTQQLHLNRFLHPLQNLESLSLIFPNIHQFSQQDSLLSDIASLLLNTQSASKLNKCILDLSSSAINDDIFVQLAQGLSRLSNTRNLCLSLKGCENITDKTLQTFAQLITFVKYKNIHQLNADFSLSAAISRSNNSGETILQTISETMATSLTSLVLNLTPKRPTGASSRDESTISKLLFNLPYLKKCNVNLSNKQSKIFKNFKDKAILTEKMLVSTQAINNSKPISSLFRKEIMFDIAEFLH